ncbi:uncharacterized protein [Chironomus tepperi]|uniref:uncharacterized protein isoform X2 n=1 Tax=Chironomus tepperi TaxID=113505 RepID=UPI00391FB5DD
MFMRILVLVVAVFVIQINAKSCRDVVDMKIHPIDCCTYPSLYDDDKLLKQCEQQCTSEPSKPYCARVCFLKELEVYSDRKLKHENIKNVFTSAGQQSGRGNVGDAYKDILDENIKKCLTEHNVAETVEEENAAMVVFDLINCIRRYNFIACPDYKDNSECTEMKDAIKTCDKSTEDMLFGVFHEQRKADKEKGTMAVEQGHGNHAGR